MTKKNFLRMIRHRAARVAVGASAVRGQGASGIGKRARDFFCGLQLAPFATSDQRQFTRALNGATRRLMRVLPTRASSWGLSRKLLNIFLRDSLYVVYLREAYGLGAAEKLLEIPLDSITAGRIRQRVPELSRWRGVKHVEPDLSSAYQAAALTIAKREGIARVHLDAFWWGAQER